MKTNYHNSFIVLLGTIAVMSLHVSRVQPSSIHNDHETSLEKCITYLDRLQARYGPSDLRPQQISTLQECSDTIENIYSHIPPAVLHRLRFLGPKSDDMYEYSKERGIPVAIGNSHTGRIHDEISMFPSREEALNSQRVYPKLTENIFGKLAQIEGILARDLASPVGSDTNDVSNGPVDLNSVEFNNGALKLNGKLLSRLRHLSGEPRTSSAINAPKENLEDVQKDGSASESDVAWANMAQHTKRASGNWLNAVKKEVAKRRRATLSINNALMALTDMVMEHGREKQMRNRDNLRYHMFIQG